MNNQTKPLGFTVYSLQFTVYSLQFTVYSLQFTEGSTLLLVAQKQSKHCVTFLLFLFQGWGITSHTTNRRTATLQQTVLPVVQSPHKGCHNNREVVCVGNGFGSRPDGSQHANACRGDSGGPLVCEENGKWSVEGVASYVHTYCKYYTAYAPVNKYLSWIKQYVPTL